MRADDGARVQAVTGDLRRVWAEMHQRAGELGRRFGCLGAGAPPLRGLVQ